VGSSEVRVRVRVRGRVRGGVVFVQSRTERKRLGDFENISEVVRGAQPQGGRVPE
jgi:hypothetical protein